MVGAVVVVLEVGAVVVVEGVTIGPNETVIGDGALRGSAALPVEYQ